MGDWVACTSEPNGWLRWIECHVALSGYLQAIGTALAVFGAALITAWSTKRILAPQVKEREGRARVLIYRVLPAVSRIRATSVRVRQAFNQTNHGFMLADNVEQALFYFTIDANIPVDVLSETHVLNDELAEKIAALHNYLLEFNEFVRLNVPRMAVLPDEARAKFVETFDTLLAPVEHLSAVAYEQLQKVRHAPNGDRVPDSL